MSNDDYMLLVQAVKTCLRVVLFLIVLIYAFKKLNGTFKKGTTDPIDFPSVSKLISLGLTVLLLWTKINNLFSSVFRLIFDSFDHLAFLFLQGRGNAQNTAAGGFYDRLSGFEFADLILIFSVWIFINTLLNVLFQGTSPHSPRIFSDKLLAKNTLVVCLLVFSIYLCVASIVAIPEFQALERAELDKEELTEFEKEISRQTGNTKEDLSLKQLPAADLKLNQSIYVYNRLNDKITNYNQIINALWEEQETRKNLALDAYKAAILEKTASREIIKYRTLLKRWVQDRSSVFTVFVIYKPRFESIARDISGEVIRVEKDSTWIKNINGAALDSVYEALWTKLDDWEREMAVVGEGIFNTRNISNAVPAKPKIGEQYGVFRSMSGWLLATESMSLALIVGLFAFGLLGAIGSMFIRQRLKTNLDTDTGDLIPNLPAVLINGISSAIVVFLAVKGTVVIFTGTDAGLNPYVLFFTCLVAAVFSEDVWRWAQGKLHDNLGYQERSKQNLTKNSEQKKV